VGSAGGNLTMAACCLEICGAETGGVGTLDGDGGGGGGGADDDCGVGGGDGAGVGGVSTGAFVSVAFGTFSALGVALVGAGPPTIHTNNIHYSPQ